jgi:hypothetical protein
MAPIPVEIKTDCTKKKCQSCVHYKAIVSIVELMTKSKRNFTLTQLSARYPATEVIVPKIINGLGPYLSNMDPPMIARVKTSAAWREPIQAVTDLLDDEKRFSMVHDQLERKESGAHNG